MIASRLIAFPEGQRILRIHLVATPFLALQWALMAMVPVLLRDHFKASEWQTAVSTASIPMMSLLSILWNEVYRRVHPVRYLQLLWLLAIAPMAGIAFSHQAGTVLVWVVISAIGFGAMTPMTADILRSCYPPAVRGRIFSVLQVISQSTLMIATYGIGVWLDIDHESFRVYLPAGVVIVGLGMWLLGRVAHQPLFMERHRTQPSEALLPSLRNAYWNMGAALARDPTFRRYEIAFFVYGLGWMICHALLPFLVVDVLNLNYEEVARSTQTVFQLTLMIMMLPTGHVMDRLGPIRTSSWAFAVLILYPIALMAARDVNTLMLATMVFGIGISGVQLAWTIGPVTLARDAAHAPHYLAIHATLVGVRAIIGQFSAVAAYRLSGDVRIPLAVAVVLFAGGALLMSRLERDRQLAERTAVEAVPMPPEHTRIP